GAYLAGLIIENSGFADVLYDKVESLSYSLFIPVFLINIGLSTNVSELGNSLAFVTSLTIMAVATKTFGGSLGARLAGFSLTSSLVVGTGLVSRGEIALIMASLGMSKGIIDGNMFVSLVIMVLITTVLTPLMLKQVLNR
ncbi:MAG: cation:proton antiporter, partial [Bacillota bacterium]|nr:cation:proton antiporter [Bacillota bacterium]